MKIIRHNPSYVMPSLEQLTKQYAFLRSVDSGLSMPKERAEKEHIKFIDTLDSLGAFENPEDKMIFTQLRMLSRARKLDEIPAKLKSFVTEYEGSEPSKRPSVIANKYKREILKPSAVNFTNYVTIPELLALYPEERIDSVAANVTKAIYGHYFDLTSGEIIDTDFMLATDEKHLIRPANMSVGAFIKQHSPIFKQLEQTKAHYDDFDTWHDRLLSDVKAELDQAGADKKHILGTIEKQTILKEGLEAYLSKDVGNLPGHESVDEILTKNLNAVKSDLEDQQHLLQEAQNAELRDSFLLGCFTVDPHECLVNNVPEEFNF